MNLYTFVQFSESKPEKKKPGFLKRHWKKIALGAGLTGLGALTAINAVRSNNFKKQANANADEYLKLEPELLKRREKQARQDAADAKIESFKKGVSSGFGKMKEGFGKFGKGVSDKFREMQQNYKNWEAQENAKLRDQYEKNKKYREELERQKNYDKNRKEDTRKVASEANKATKEAERLQRQIEKKQQEISKSLNRPLVPDPVEKPVKSNKIEMAPGAILV